MKHVFFTSFLICIFSVIATTTQAITFKEQVLKSQNGDYAVYEKNNHFSVILIKNINKKELLLEEISTDKKQHNWKEWVQKGALNSTSWTICSIDVVSGKIIESYSFSKRAWLNMSNEENLFLKLLNIEMKPLKKNLWRKIGPPPTGDLDTRPTWYPTLYMDGIITLNVSWEVYETIWPNDNTEFSNKTLNFYFVKDLLYLPIWLQITTSYGMGILKAVDCGHNMISPQKEIF
jgi:hypothetical protein